MIDYNLLQCSSCVDDYILNTVWNCKLSVMYAGVYIILNFNIIITDMASYGDEG